MNLSNTPQLPRAVPPSRLGRLAALGAAALIAGCGSSGSSTIAVGDESTAANAARRTHPRSTTGTTPTSGPLSTEPTITPPKGPAPTTLVTKEIVTGTGAEAKAGESVTVNYVGALYSNGKVFNASWETQRTVHLHARRGPGHHRLGQGRRGNERGRPARADHPRRTGVRQARAAAEDPAELAADLHRRPARPHRSRRSERLTSRPSRRGGARGGRRTVGSARAAAAHPRGPPRCAWSARDLVLLAHTLQRLQALHGRRGRPPRARCGRTLAGGLPRSLPPRERAGGRRRGAPCGGAHAAHGS